MATVLEGAWDEGGPPDGELQRLREENRKLALVLGAYSAFIASRGLLEEAWRFIHNIHQMDDGLED